MNNRISKIQNNVQDRNSMAWKKLCEYIDEVANNGTDEFDPREALGDDLFSEIYTLPESIAKLKKVKKVALYGSSLKRIPPEIGEMESLEYFDPYTSYYLHWFPYEITKCQKLKESRISTRALYGNFRTRKGFPQLNNNPVRYYKDHVNCSICEKSIDYKSTNQMWVTVRIGTDTVPLLANLCSKACEQKLAKPPKNYIQTPHKGGADLVQPPDENTLWEIEMAEMEKAEIANENNQGDIENIKDKSKNIKKEKTPFSLIKLVKKIWDN